MPCGKKKKKGGRKGGGKKWSLLLVLLVVFIPLEAWAFVETAAAAGGASLWPWIAGGTAAVGAGAAGAGGAFNAPGAAGLSGQYGATGLNTTGASGVEQRLAELGIDPQALQGLGLDPQGIEALLGVNQPPAQFSPPAFGEGVPGLQGPQPAAINFLPTQTEAAFSGANALPSGSGLGQDALSRGLTEGAAGDFGLSTTAAETVAKIAPSVSRSITNPADYGSLIKEGLRQGKNIGEQANREDSDRPPSPSGGSLGGRRSAVPRSLPAGPLQTLEQGGDPQTSILRNLILGLQPVHAGGAIFV